ncbi:histone-like nucleoid-structuring protein Lsr2 [Mycolicibacterium palauense]|uniref:histone-like nucleoid-structuring protein Lsr2 n=1 Tax=Mycolicibacterium palauense TaxID=2034511 RepID=UPI000BFEFBE6
MARETLVRMWDDLDKSQLADTTRELGWDGQIYVLDLTEEHAEELQSLLQPYLDSAHERLRWTKGRRGARGATSAPVTQSGRGTSSSTRSFGDKETRAAIRQWGRDNGYEVSDRGFLPSSLVEAYQEAHEKRRPRGSRKRAQ